MRTLLLTITLATVIFPTIATYRAGVQPSYEWGLPMLSGVGTAAPSYWYLLAVALFGWVTFIAGSQSRERAFRPLVVLWWSMLLASMSGAALAGGFELRGDAIGVRLDGRLLGPAAGIAGVILAVLSVLRPPQSQKAAVPSIPALGTAAALTPVIIGLFAQGDGEQHQATDVLAIGAVVAQCLLVAHGLDSAKSGHTVTAGKSVR